LVSAPEIKSISSPPPVRQAVVQNLFDFDREKILEVIPPSDGNDKRRVRPVRGEKGIAAWAIAAMIFGGIFLLFVGGLILLVLFSFAGQSSVMSRQQFQAAVIGKTPAEVIRSVGTPDFTGHDSNGNEYFLYHNRVRDPVSGNLDWTSRV
jgi:hypothetical protein